MKPRILKLTILAEAKATYPLPLILLAVKKKAIIVSFRYDSFDCRCTASAVAVCEVMLIIQKSPRVRLTGTLNI